MLKVAGRGGDIRFMGKGRKKGQKAEIQKSLLKARSQKREDKRINERPGKEWTERFLTALKRLAYCPSNNSVNRRLQTGKDD